jgi:[ribosomal protein S5]-alanine N-acetyltransferase
MSVTIETIAFQHGLPPVWPLGDFSLRPLQPNDYPSWSEYLSDPRVTAHTSWGNVDLPTINALVDRCISEYSSGTSCRWALADSRDNLVGTCGFSQWSLPHSHAELVYDLSPEYWRRGLMSRAVAIVLDWAFRTVGFNRVHAFVMDTNQPSRSLLERAGFGREGLLRQYRLAHGVPRDFFIYSRLRELSVALPSPARPPARS